MPQWSLTGNQIWIRVLPEIEGWTKFSVLAVICRLHFNVRPCWFPENWINRPCGGIINTPSEVQDFNKILVWLLYCCPCIRVQISLDIYRVKQFQCRAQCDIQYYVYKFLLNLGLLLILDIIARFIALILPWS